MHTRDIRCGILLEREGMECGATAHVFQLLLLFRLEAAGAQAAIHGKVRCLQGRATRYIASVSSPAKGPCYT